MEKEELKYKRMKLAEKNRGYIVNEVDEFECSAIVATSVREVKKIVYAEGDFQCDWIDLRIRWIKDADVSNLPIGVLRDGKEGLKRGFYSYIEYETCDVCGADDTLELVGTQALCGDCAEKAHNAGEKEK